VQHSTKILFFSLFIVCFSFFTSSYAQVDSVNLRFESLTGFSTQGYLPMYIGANRYGVINDNRTDALVRLGSDLYFYSSKHFDLQGGLDFIGRPSIVGTHVQQAYLKSRLFFMEMRIGAMEETTGIHDPSLSTGSLALSRNARPMTKLMLSVPEYTPVPFTFGFVHFKGLFAHGWFEEDRYIQSPYLHEKNIYIKFGGDLPVNFHAGFVHYAVWGGIHPEKGRFPSGIKDLPSVMFGKEGDETSEDFVHGGEIGNALGDHLGIFDFALDLKLPNYKVTLYHQTPYEDGSSLRLMRNKDRLLGVNVRKQKPGLVSGILYEFLYTKYQSGHGTPDHVPGQESYGYRYGGRDDYYNNYLYRTGWTFHGRSLGTPLFTTFDRAQHYFDEVSQYAGVIFVNNRVVAHHLGVEGTINKLIEYRALATYSLNYGSYAGLNGGRYRWGSKDPNFDHEAYEFYPYLTQCYFMLEALTKLPFAKNVQVITTLAYDTGQMTNNFGAMVGLRWNGLMERAQVAVK
jgi:hypothetical protein